MRFSLYFLACLLLFLAGCGGSGGDSTPVTQQPVTRKLNDTGIVLFADSTSNSLTSEPAGFEGQDASYGRDAQAAAGTLTKIGGGRAGFDFTKLGSDGAPLADQSADYATSPWDCVRDNVTGLTWEVKANDGGLRDLYNLYTWYNTDPATNGGSAGDQNGGRCNGGIDCDTRAFVTAVNAVGLCGYNDWRLPQMEELRSVVDYSVAGSLIIDTAYFPNATQNLFWSASPVAGVTDNAWGVNFYYGYGVIDYKSGYGGVRLVRGGQ
ncbi:DUF1566 domain-containing protein [Geothermobacter hydrogeniphilus]|uniref:Lcl C-terminal domain-containing protein n=1 Tax=Geothermobacter hydrogeniphilus TaxID=1969733 RepID=A0A1X0XLE6_9BACT|nr:DUF1566 domain-containing protein [Geothermobacter hydrogeniphilus]ORJ53668.1 hypothetical protein B5V00_16335 [Geothermobacter hydrogeniphilus]